MQMDKEDYKVADVNSTRPVTRLHPKGDLWNEDRSSHPETSSLCNDQRPLLHKSVNSKTLVIKANPTNQLKRFGSKENNIGNMLVQDTRYSALNNHVLKKPNGASHFDIVSPSTDIGNTRALAGLIVMCNDRVRRSFFKYGVLGVPLRKKPNLDRVDANTLIFLFEFEARALWGIYQASSEVSIDIEKDAYRGSETAFPAQVKFHILQKCRPLPEKLFKLAIADNYYTPTKFHFELTDEQVTFLTRLYYVRDVEKLGVNNMEKTTTFYEIAGKQRFLEAVYPDDGVRTNGINTNGMNTPNSQRSHTTLRPFHCKELLARIDDNSETNTSVPDKNLTDGAPCDYPRYLFWHSKNCPNLKTHEDCAHVLKNQALDYSADDEQNHGCTSNTTLLEPRRSSLYCYPQMDEKIPSEDDLRRQLCQPKLLHNSGNPIYKPCDLPKSSPDAAMGSNVRTDKSFNEENYLHMLTLEQSDNSIHSKLLPLRSRQPDIPASQRLHRGISASDVALWNLPSHSKKSLNACLTMCPPANLEKELSPGLQAWQTHEILQDAENGPMIETLNKRHLISSEDAYVQPYEYSAEGFPLRGRSSTQSHDDTLGRGSACIRRRAPQEEVWQDDLCRKRLMMLRRKSVPDIETKNPVCTAKCCQSERETVNSDDEHWLESILCNVKDYIHKRHEVGNRGAWLGDDGHVSADTSTVLSKSCNGDPLIKEEQEMQVEADQKDASELRLRHQNSSPCASVAPSEVERVKPPRKSVWSRLSASRSWLEDCSRQQIPIPSEDKESEVDDQLYVEALPWKRKGEIADYEVEESEPPSEESSAFVEDGFNVHFKRRKLSTSRTADSPQEQGVVVRVDDSSVANSRLHSNNPRERRKIRRPL
ncbi:hypothetical protein L7F22_036526 [Adiantum nelumboides]|nr:hypothetical protein [Adiantum nelumboides]